MKTKNIYIALLISLAFNAGFIVSFFYQMYVSPKPLMPPPPPHNPKIHQVFKNEEMVQIRKDNIKLRMEFFKELSQPTVNYSKIDELILNLDESQRVLESKILLHFIQIRKEMSEEEAEEFFGKFHQRYESRREKNKKEHRRKQ